MPSRWRAWSAGDYLVPFLAIILGLRPAMSLGMAILRRKVSWGSDELISVAMIAGGVALVWWHISRIRRAFRQGREIVARVTHFDRVPFHGPGARFPLPNHMLHVAYHDQGVECAFTYGLSVADADRLHPTIGGEVVLIQHPQLEKPLLRDLYLDP
jgi:hypothetical protein